MVALTCGVIFGAGYLRKKGYVLPEDLSFAINVLKLSSAVIDELDLKQEKQIKAITNFIVISLKMAEASANVTTKDQLLDLARKNCYKLCESTGIKITASRTEIIETLLDIAFTNSYADKYIPSYDDDMAAAE